MRSPASSAASHCSPAPCSPVALRRIVRSILKPADRTYLSDWPRNRHSHRNRGRQVSATKPEMLLRFSLECKSSPNAAGTTVMLRESAVSVGKEEVHLRPELAIPEWSDEPHKRPRACDVPTSLPDRAAVSHAYLCRSGVRRTLSSAASRQRCRRSSAAMMRWTPPRLDRHRCAKVAAA